MEKRPLVAPCPEPRRTPDNKKVVLYCGGKRTKIIIGDRSYIVCSECDAPSPVAVAH